MQERLERAERQRLFWAVVPPLALREQLGAAFAQAAQPLLAGGLRAIEPVNLHLTLCFLGSASVSRLPELQQVGADVAHNHSAFDLSLGGGGAFPNTTHAKVVWLGVQRGAAELTALAQQVRSASTLLGFPREERAFTPHLTLGRCKRALSVQGTLAALKLPALDFMLSELVLMRSHVDNQGARYEPLQRHVLRVA